MMKSSYYDGPIIVRDISLDELEEEIKKEKEISDSLESWEEI